MNKKEYAQANKEKLYPEVPDSLWAALGLEKGVAPEELKLIYITHLHPDNIGGLLKEGKVVFPNAEVYVKHLHMFEAGDTLEGGVKSIAAYGHTPGHTVFQKDSILVIADLIHGAALQLEHPEYCPTYDMNPDAARESRLRILKYARENHLTMYGMHLPSPGFIK